MSALGFLIAIACAAYVGWGVGHTGEWCKVLRYLKAQGVEDWVVIGITVNEHHDPPSEWAQRASDKDRERTETS